MRLWCIYEYVVHYQVPVGHPAEVDEIFDAISYSKGASVIRMLHSWIGDNVSLTTVYHNVLPLSCLCWAPHIIHLRIGMKVMTYLWCYLYYDDECSHLYIHPLIRILICSNQYIQPVIILSSLLIAVYKDSSALLALSPNGDYQDVM